MWLPHKKSKIIDWWIAGRERKLSLKNILSGNTEKRDLCIVGYWKEWNGKRRISVFTMLPMLLCTTKRIVHINKNGVLTSDMTFYPFKEAHPIYLKFLEEANKPDGISTYNWYVKINEVTGEYEAIADRIVDGIDINSFKLAMPDRNIRQLKEYFTQRHANIVIMPTWSKNIPKNTCLIGSSISKSIQIDIFNALVIDKVLFC